MAKLATVLQLTFFTVVHIPGNKAATFQYFFDLGKNCERMFAKAQTCLEKADVPGADRYREKLRFPRVRENMNNCLKREFSRGEHFGQTCKSPEANYTLHDCLRVGLQTYEPKLIGAEARRFVVHVKDCVFQLPKRGRAYVEMMTTVLAGQGAQGDLTPFFAEEEIPLMMTTSGRAPA